MSRRSRSRPKNKSNLAVYIIIALAVLAAAAIGFIMIRKSSDPFPGIKELNRADLLEGGRSINRNIYRITGKISERRTLSGESGAMIFVNQTDEAPNHGTIPVRVPQGVTNINLEKGFSYVFKVKINRVGLPVALDVKAQ